MFHIHPSWQTQQKKQPMLPSSPATTFATYAMRILHTRYSFSQQPIDSTPCGRCRTSYHQSPPAKQESVTRCLTFSALLLSRSYHHQTALSPTTTNAYLGLCISIELLFAVIPIYIYNIGTLGTYKVRVLKFGQPTTSISRATNLNLMGLGQTPSAHQIKISRLGRTCRPHDFETTTSQPS